ncbi:anthranilate phosphoribosyltransferase [Thorsellia anophelis]|uniref:Anthranilate phosphoribosyltransferase n=1 Tax=Thorsellia anophelis DSM 18579 TaxID=1123402 RepID=A0A1I0BLW4_9GAMM|nr:anthranilate phosphoribosyltransferase [Thorsellia anophelis]SET07264.1 anthranilate phosphoribosyltransferase [Thorsellia anophelis DSM 18579]
MQTLLNKLYTGQALNQLETKSLFIEIIKGNLDQAQLAGALIGMKVRGETPAEIAGAAEALLSDAKVFPSPDYLFADIVGTGGDGSDSINISTASAFVAAACGLKIAKHGNKSVSSQSGSSDLLAAFGVDLNMPPDISRKALDTLNVCFLFAPLYHTGFKHAMPVRQLLKTRTIFNVLGPLINPAHPPLALVGVYSEHLIKPMAEALLALNYQRAMVVHGNGMDEVTIDGPTHVAELNNGKIIEYMVTPDDFGLPTYSQNMLKGGDPTLNRSLITQLLQGHGEKAHNAAVAINVAMLMRLFGHENLSENTRIILDVIESGKAFNIVTQLSQLQK